MRHSVPDTFGVTRILTPVFSRIVLAAKRRRHAVWGFNQEFPSVGYSALLTAQDSRGSSRQETHQTTSTNV